MTLDMAQRIRFDDEAQIMEVDFSNLRLTSSADVNAVFDQIEELIDATGEEKWFFLVNFAGERVDPAAWFTYTRRGKALHKAHSQGAVRYDESDDTRREIARTQGTENYNPNLFADRDNALVRLKDFKTQRRAKLDRTPQYTAQDILARLNFVEDDEIMEVDFSNLVFRHSGDVDLVYDTIEDAIIATGRKWFFLVNYEASRIHNAAWVSYARRGKHLNLSFALGSVRYAPGSETEETIRMRAESQGFRPNVRNTREEALERIDEMKRETA
ncbi:hypothetical protein [Aliiroseovarius subalbicans]|uniref:hypothetical protein n=1 Tax=Aliiroseovarius subalbicans TaxID=2925840 RepID=UPI001F55AF1E|nr:hypothetical protein [Aliiroseovarius subalbicans]MCI2399819.1 hypothetical protein [Aliiroseovarius subalbicans]